MKLGNVERRSNRPRQCRRRSSRRSPCCPSPESLGPTPETPALHYKPRPYTRNKKMPGPRTKNEPRQCRRRSSRRGPCCPSPASLGPTPEQKMPDPRTKNTRTKKLSQSCSSRPYTRIKNARLTNEELTSAMSEAIISTRSLLSQSCISTTTGEEKPSIPFSESTCTRGERGGVRCVYINKYMYIYMEIDEDR